MLYSRAVGFKITSPPKSYLVARGLMDRQVGRQAGKQAVSQAVV